MVVPMYASGYFKDETSSLVIGVLFGGPYAGYLVFRILGILIRSFGWAVQVTVKS